MTPNTEGAGENRTMIGVPRNGTPIIPEERTCGRDYRLRFTNSCSISSLVVIAREFA